MTLAEALQRIVPTSSADSRMRAEAWAVIEAEIQTVWSARHASQLGGDSDLADDVRQTVLEKLLSGKATFAGSSDGEAISFVRTLARYATVDTFRRRKYEARIDNDDLDKVGGSTLADDGLHARDVSRRLTDVVQRATELADSPTRPSLERHLRETIHGQAAADKSLDVDRKEAARLRKERSRALALLRRAHDDLAANDVAHEMNEDVERIVRAILASPRATASEP
jgi:DNA-directed RNA polymerase specialized sigma24 family protein